MERFKVTYLDGNGGKIEKEMYAHHESEILEQLSESKFTPLTIKKASKSVVELLRGDGVSKATIETFITNLASLLSSGINLDKALTLLSKSADTASLKSLISVLQKDVRGGETFANTLAKHPEYFDSLVINLVKIGESTGRLDDVLVDLSEQLKFQQKIASQIKQAAIYPLIIVAICVISVLFILVSVVPQLSGMLEQVKDLPGYTVALMTASEFVRSTAGIISLAAFVVMTMFTIFSQAKEIKAFRASLWRVFRSLPIINSMQFLTMQLRFSSAMMATLRAGLSLTDAVELSANTLPDEDVKSKLHEIKRRIQSGEPLAGSMEEASLFSSMEIGFIDVGEETGELTKAFTEIQQRKSFEFDTRLASLLKLLEPLLILIMGVIVGGIVIIMMLSIMSAQDVGL
ncbi:type II secretion system F family protein [Pseudoalteromonas sp. MMG024]|uniref:type II secretion system F family protein n=1 Tax=Pseudoalteromonas sp. MMG024 TaxID=2909980 RepID=UPI001F16FA3B|nr:type II secretion system F family protein [Pseudoalteromonas sp. MMG024]MCF6457524.1 type II secretion system F family protein [Pseudoalteromonas sp. MMG024]